MDKGKTAAPIAHSEDLKNKNQTLSVRLAFFTYNSRITSNFSQPLPYVVSPHLSTNLISNCLISI